MGPLKESKETGLQRSPYKGGKKRGWKSGHETQRRVETSEERKQGGESTQRRASCLSRDENTKKEIKNRGKRKR